MNESKDGTEMIKHHHKHGREGLERFLPPKQQHFGGDMRLMKKNCKR
jgi:hypothetical protein